MDHRGVAGNVTEFDGNLGLVIGAGGGVADALRRGARARRQARQLLRDRRQPVGREGRRAGQAGAVQKPGVDKIAVMMSIVSNTRVDIVARGVDQGVPRARLRPGREDRDLPHPRRVGGRGLQDPREVRRRVLRPLACRCTRRRGGRWRRSAGMSILDRRGHHLHRPGHHRPRGRQPDARVPRLRHGREGRRRGHARAQGPRRPRRAGVRHRRAGRRAPRRPDRRLGRHRPPRLHARTPSSRRIENGIKLIVIVTERIPRRDVAQMVELAVACTDARIIGPNCLGMIVPDVIKMGGIGGPAKDAAKAYTPGSGRRDVALAAA